MIGCTLLNFPFSVIVVSFLRLERRAHRQSRSDFADLGRRPHTQVTSASRRRFLTPHECTSVVAPPPPPMQCSRGGRLPHILHRPRRWGTWKWGVDSSGEGGVCRLLSRAPARLYRILGHRTAAAAPPSSFVPVSLQLALSLPIRRLSSASDPSPLHPFPSLPSSLAPSSRFPPHPLLLVSPGRTPSPRALFPPPTDLDEPQSATNGCCCGALGVCRCSLAIFFPQNGHVSFWSLHCAAGTRAKRCTCESSAVLSGGRGGTGASDGRLERRGRHVL